MEDKKNNPSSPPNKTEKSFTIPHGFKCPLTGQIMEDPVIVTTQYGPTSFNGYSYEREAIQKNLTQDNDINPVSEEKLLPWDTNSPGQKFQTRHLIPNYHLKNSIAEFKEHSPVSTREQPLEEIWLTQELHIHALLENLIRLQASLSKVQWLDEALPDSDVSTHSSVPEISSLLSTPTPTVEEEATRNLPPLAEYKPMKSDSKNSQPKIDPCQSAQAHLALNQNKAALLLLLEAAKQGLIYAYPLLNEIYSSGLNGPLGLLDEEKARICQSLAFKHIAEFQQAAKQNNAEAQYYLALFYKKVQNYPVMFYWLEKSAAQGNASAQFELGACHHSGISGEKNLSKAVAWYQIAIKQQPRLAAALFQLSLCYEKGEGVEKDAALALQFLQAAAAQGHRDACYQLGQHYFKDKNFRQEGITLMQRAAFMGHAHAQVALGNYFSKIKMNFAAASYCYQRALAQGYQGHIHLYESLHNQHPELSKWAVMLSPKNLTTRAENPDDAKSDSHGDTRMNPKKMPITASIESFQCAIKRNIMRTPLTTSMGQSYSSEAIHKWLFEKEKSTDPLTGKAVPNVLIINTNLMQVIYDLELQSLLMDNIAEQEQLINHLTAITKLLASKNPTPSTQSTKEHTSGPSLVSSIPPAVNTITTLVHPYGSGVFAPCPIHQQSSPPITSGDETDEHTRTYS